MCESDLRRTAKLVAFALERFMDAAGFCFPSTATVAKASSLGERAVEGARQELEDAGWLVRLNAEETHRGGKGKTAKLIAALPQTAHAVRRLEFETAQRKYPNGAAQSPNGAAPAPEDVEDILRGSAGRLGGAVPLDDCMHEGCVLVAALEEVNGKLLCPEHAAAAKAKAEAHG